MTIVEQFRDQGTNEGIKKGKLETAKNMFKHGISLDLIKKITGLPNKQIENLSKK